MVRRVIRSGGLEEGEIPSERMGEYRVFRGEAGNLGHTEEMINYPAFNETVVPEANIEFSKNYGNLKPKTREEVKALVKRLGFSKVRTLSASDLYAHVVPDRSPTMWIPIQLSSGMRTVTNRIMQYAYGHPPSPVKIPDKYIVTKTKRGYMIRERAPPRRVIPEPRRVIPEPLRPLRMGYYNFDTHEGEERTEWGWRPIGWTQEKEDEIQENDVLAEARYLARILEEENRQEKEDMIKKLTERSNVARQRWKSIIKRVIREPYRRREREIIDLIRENKARREEIKREYRQRHPLAKTNAFTRVPTRTNYLGHLTKGRGGILREIPKQELNEERMARSIAKFKLSRVKHEALRRESKVILTRPEIWTEDLFVRGKKCEAYTIAELRRILKKYEPEYRPSENDSKAKLCERLEQIKISLRRFKNK